MTNERKWRVGPVLWKDGFAGYLTVGYIGFDLDDDCVLGSLLCSNRRLSRIADYAGKERGAFIAEVNQYLEWYAEGTPSEWTHRLGSESDLRATICRSALLYVNGRPEYTMDDHLKSYVRYADQTWEREV